MSTCLFLHTFNLFLQATYPLFFLRRLSVFIRQRSSLLPFSVQHQHQICATSLDGVLFEYLPDNLASFLDYNLSIKCINLYANFHLRAKQVYSKWFPEYPVAIYTHAGHFVAEFDKSTGVSVACVTLARIIVYVQTKILNIFGCSFTPRPINKKCGLYFLHFLC